MIRKYGENYRKIKFKGVFNMEKKNQREIFCPQVHAGITSERVRLILC